MQFMGRDSWSGALAAAASLGPVPQGMPLPRWHTGSLPPFYGGPESPAELTPAEEGAGELRSGGESGISD